MYYSGAGLGSGCRNVIVSSLYPLGGNYGGILQAYALQSVIRSLGYDVWTINSSRRLETARLLLRRSKHFYRRVFLGVREPIPLGRSRRKLIEEEPRKFVVKHIDTIDLLGSSRSSRRDTLSRTRAIVVGSDQVWRGGMADVLDQLLQYAKGFPIIKLSYAASFGSDRLVRYSPRVLRESRRLAQLFSGISVREDDAVELCRKHWGVSALHHVDPTLLLRRGHYEDLVSDGHRTCAESRGRLLVYVLDRSASVEAVVASVSKKTGLNVAEFYVESPRSSRQYRSDRSRYQMRPVEDWLANFMEADFVITDSFHGTVFSIIFNKPFVAIGNRSRGLSRFESLLRMAGLDSRLIDLECELTKVDLSPIDWAAVDKKFDHERNRGLEYLRRGLRGVDR